MYVYTHPNISVCTYIEIYEASIQQNQDVQTWDAFTSYNKVFCSSLLRIQISYKNMIHIVQFLFFP